MHSNTPLCSVILKRPWPRQQLQEKVFNWILSCSFRGLVQYHHIGEHGWRHPGASAVAESCILIHRQRETETGTDRQRQRDRDIQTDSELDMGFWNFQTHPQRHTSSNKTTPVPTRPHVLVVLLSADLEYVCIVLSFDSVLSEGGHG